MTVTEEEKELPLLVAEKLRLEIDRGAPTMGVVLSNSDARTISRVLREAAEGWRGIASAPKDGTWILAWRGPAQNGSVWTNPVAVRWFEFEEDEDGAWCWPDSIYEVMSDDGKDRANSLLVEGECYDDNTNFTHWRPLPAPPS